MIKSPEIRIDYNQMAWLIVSLPLIKAYLAVIHRGYPCGSVDDWMKRPNPDFDYQTPEALLHDGDFDTLDAMKMALQTKFKELLVDDSE